MNTFYTATDHFVLVPAIMLAMFACGVFLIDFLGSSGKQQSKLLLGFVTLGLASSAYALWKQFMFLVDQHMTSMTAFHGALTVDGFSLFFNWLFLAASLIVILVSYRYLEIEDENHAEYYGLILLANCGMFFLATGSDLITLFIGLELMALSFYIMVGFLRRDKRSNEAALKYMLLGAFSSGFLVYGFSVMYGLSGSTNLNEIGQAIAARDTWDPVVFLAFATTAVGLLFKISAVPFHMWAPDAYEGAPTPITAYLSVASKAASFAFLLRIFLGPLESIRAVWMPMLAVIAILTMTVGNLAAISQTNVKRLLAYSSISHAGYMLLGLIAGNSTGIKGIAVYLLVYTFMNLGAFLVIVALRRKEIIGDDIEDLSGLMHKSPGYAVLMLIFMASLAGIPPTAGFLGKYYIFLSLIETQHYVLAVIATLYVAVAVYYYFRVVRSMFVNEAADKLPVASSFGLRLAAGLTGAMTLAMGIFPEYFLRLAQISTSVLR
jgi:NADH-quinone oxidoreductase subunit N